MKKKTIIRLIIIFALVILLIVSFVIHKNNQKTKVQERYAEIREGVKSAVEWNIKAQIPGCSIEKEVRNDSTPYTFYNSSFLLKNGYIKKEELLDVDGESYCDVYVDINVYFEDPLNHQQNCETYYKIYLKCKYYVDEGYVDWD